MGIQKITAEVIKKISTLLRSIDDDDYEIYREEFEVSMGARSLQRNPDNTYADQEVMEAWIALCDSKIEDIMRIW